MATKTQKPVFVNTTIKVDGAEAINKMIQDAMLAGEACNQLAIEAIGRGDRKGVALQMKVATIYARTARSLERAIARSQRVRLTREERKQYELNGTLPANVTAVIPDADDDDDDDDLDA